MASIVDICNLALAHLGDAAAVSAIDPPDGSVQADHCARFYPIALAAMLELHAWRFATRREALQLISTTELPDVWGYAYALPNSCVRVLKVLLPGYTDETKSETFVQEALSTGERVIFTNAEDAEVQFIYNTTDPTKFSGLFIVALARLLASYVAGPLLKGPAGRKESAEQFNIFLKVEFPNAAAMDARVGESAAYDDFTPSSITVRA